MKRALLITLVWLLPVVSGCDRAEPVRQSGIVVKVGFVGPLQGPEGPRGEDRLEGVMTAQALQPLLPNGDRLEIITADSGVDPQSARTAMRRLVEEDGVVALLLALDSEALLEVAAFADSLETPLVALIASHPDVVADTAHIVQLPFDDTTQSTVAALFVRDELLIKRAAVIANPDNPHSRYLTETFERKFITTGGDLTGSHAVADISDELLRHLQAKNTELLYLPLSAQAALEVVSALGAIGWAPEIMTSDGLLASIQGAYPDRVHELEGVYATDLFSDTGEFVKHRRLGRQAEVSFSDLFHSRKNTFSGLGGEG